MDGSFSDMRSPLSPKVNFPTNRRRSPIFRHKARAGAGKQFVVAWKNWRRQPVSHPVLSRCAPQGCIGTLRRAPGNPGRRDAHNTFALRAARGPAGSDDFVSGADNEPDCQVSRYFRSGQKRAARGDIGHAVDGRERGRRSTIVQPVPYGILHANWPNLPWLPSDGGQPRSVGSSCLLDY